MSASIAPTAEPLLSVEHVQVRFGGLVAIADLHFDVTKGEILSLIGPNGAGKTTAFNVLTGFLRPTNGRVRFRGVDLTRLKTHAISRMGLARTFQRTSVFADDTVLDNLLIALHRHGQPGPFDLLLPDQWRRAPEATTYERARELLDLVGLDARHGAKAGDLAYGEQRCVGVALALATDPELLLLDEPVSGMNASETAAFVSVLRRIRDRGITIVLVEHDMPMVMAVSDRIVCLNHGRLIATGTPASIQQDSAVIEAYLGHGSATRALMAEGPAHA
ncbi:ABC transporter ATP-binding protein [Marinivivus vitaminiproducens]|uniref:ABC transporter ATP-binding protein n=1 Tax=Marinivivus vitaminiproducens TaxID=3035935 RepID=UPI002798310F|nr:ABC transporter ATP-binding protein [Geminicoccaceae bacterium SCSIO 64248]